MSLRLVDYPSDSEGEGEGSSISTGCRKASGSRPDYYVESEQEEVENSKGGASPPDAGHVKGGWSGHVYLDISAPPAQLQRLVARCMDRITACGKSAQPLRAIDSMHITLTRPFYLQEHQIPQVVSELRRAVRDVRAPTIAFGGISTYANERRDRAFLALDVGFGREQVQQVLGCVDGVMERFGKRRFFSEPRFHVSMASFPSTQEGDADLGLDGALREDVLGLPAIRISAVSCVFGDKRFVIGLRD
ncbi:hypothetical protein GQ54DRAFT_295888 [Martensiomyces pterosporus]|nr:hypothetical protein GQ54DRAFT_295888 [Martensiomyces pterosporus]